MGFFRDIFRKADQMVGGYLPGGPTPEDVTWKDAVGQWGDAVGTLAPAASFIPGVGWVASGLAGAAGGALGTLDNDGMGRGEGGTGLGSALKSAAIRGGLSAAGGWGVDKLQAAGTAAGMAGGGAGPATPVAAGGSMPGVTAQSVAAAPTSVAPGAFTAAPMGASLPAAAGAGAGMATGAGMAGAAPPPPPKPTLGSSLRSAAGKVGSFVKENPEASAMGLQAVGNYQQGKAEQRRLGMEEDLMQSRLRDEEEDRERRRRAAQALAPLLADLYKSNMVEA